MRDGTLASMMNLVEEAGPPPDKTTQARTALQKHWTSYQRLLETLRPKVDTLGTTINYNTPSDLDARRIEDQVASLDSTTSAMVATLGNLKKAAADYRKALEAQ